MWNDLALCLTDAPFLLRIRDPQYDISKIKSHSVKSGQRIHGSFRGGVFMFPMTVEMLSGEFETHIYAGSVADFGAIIEGWGIEDKTSDEA